MKTSLQNNRWFAWGCVNTRLGDAFIEVFGTKQQMIDYAVQRCMGAHEYDRAGTNTKRWKIAYRRGWRLKRCRVEPLTNRGEHHED